MVCAFVLVIGAAVVIIKNNRSAVSSVSTTQTTPSNVTIVRRLPHYWTVRSGNTLAEISLKTGLSLSTLHRDNPHMSSVLHPGEHVDLRAPHAKAR